MTHEIPNDPFILLSYVNTLLRDQYPAFEELCASRHLDCAAITAKLNAIDYFYDAKTNQFQ